MKHNGFYEQLAAMRAERRFQQVTQEREAALAKFRKQINKGKMPAFMYEALLDLQFAFPKGAALRCRSSTNKEDLANFSGAGLYDSFTHSPDEGHIAKTIRDKHSSTKSLRQVMPKWRSSMPRSRSESFASFANSVTMTATLILTWIMMRS